MNCQFNGFFILRIIGYFTKKDEFRLDHLIPLALPLAMYFFGKPDILLVLKFWVFIVSACSFFLGIFGLNAGHHHLDVTHEGDEIE